MLEVELKFPIDDAAAAGERLVAFGAESGEAVTQSDAYFNHPARDFAETDEALRVRTVGGDSVVTYKGPRVVEPGSVAKTRFELETPLAPDTAEDWAELLRQLGFRPVATVTKRRTPFRLQRDGRSFELALDQVDGLGAFVEVETLTDESHRAEAETAVANLAAELGLLNAEPRSYLEMLLASRG